MKLSRTQFRCDQQRRRGAIFVAALLVVAALSAMVIVFGRRMTVEARASSNQAAAVQAAAVERGAEQYVLGILSDTTTSPMDQPEEDFAAISVGDGWFWVVRPDYADNSLPIYGLVDECSKLDINYASQNSLLRLPGMTEDIAGAIVDWRDPDDTPSPSGAESQTYQNAQPAYSCKNGPFETVEELLLVRGVTPQLLYGDGSAPPAGTSSSSMSQPFSGSSFNDPQLARGIYDLLTIYSSQPNTAADGTPRVSLNDRSALRTFLQRQLGNARANAILNTLGRGQILDVFDFYFRGRLTQDEFDKVGDNLTTTTGNRLRGAVNINTAPRDVLLCLPNLESSDVDKLIAQRPAPGSATTPSITWVAKTLGPKAIGLGNRITSKSTRYSADIIAANSNGRGIKRCRIVVDVGGTSPRILYRRDLSDRGWPLDPQILLSLRAGNGPGNSSMQSGGMFR